MSCLQPSHLPHRPCFVLLLVAAACLLGARPGAAQEEPEPVEVVNLPEVQTVDGTVTVQGPISQTRLTSMEAEVVSPVEPTATIDLVLVGTLETSGFKTVVLSLAGQVRAAFYRAGRVGAVLVPDVEIARIAFLEHGQLLFPLRVDASAEAGGGAYFASDQPEFPLGFDRYRVYCFNTTDRPASVTLFAYLGN